MAVGLVAASFLGRWLLRPMLGPSSPYLTSYLAVMAAAIWCGTGPALAATFVSVLIGDLFFLNPFGRSNNASIELARLAVMLIANVGIAIVGGIARSSRQKAKREAESARRADEALRESEERFRALVEATSQTVWATDERGVPYEDSPSWRAFTGQSLQTSHGWAEAVHPDDRSRVVAHWQHCVAAKVPYEIEYRLRHHSGEYRWTQARAVPQLHPDRTLKGWVGMSTDITEHKRAEASLAEARRKLDAALIAGEVGTFEWDVATDRLRPDYNFARLFGITLDSSGAAPMAEFISALHPDDRDRVMKQIRQTMDSGGDYLAEYRVGNADRTRWISGRGKVQRDAAGRALRFTGVVLDVTKRKRTEEALRESTERLKLAVDATGYGTFDFHPQTGELIWSVHAKRHFGLSPDAHVDYSVFLKGLHPEDRERINETVQKALRPESGGRYQAEYRTIGIGDGVERWLSMMGQAYFDEAGRAIRFIGAIVDITRHKRAEASLAEARRKLDAALIAGEVGTFEWDVATDRLCPDQNFARLFGLQLDRTGTAPMGDFIHVLHPDDRDRVMKQIRQTMDRSGDYQAEYRVINAGRARWISGRGKVQRDAVGRALRFTGVVLDVTKRKEAEEALVEAKEAAERSEAQQLAMFQSMTEGMVVYDPKGNLVDMNPAALAIYGFDSIESIKRNVTELDKVFEVRDLQGEALPIEQWPISRVLGGGTFGRYDVEVRRTDGSRRWIGSYGGTLVRNAQGQVIRALVTLRDVTDVKRAEEELKAAKLSAERAKAVAEDANRAKDQFFAVLSHELRTPLTPVVAGASMLQKQWRGDQVSRETLEMIRRNVEVEARLIDDLLDVTRITRGKIQLDRKPIHLCEVIRRAVEVCKPDLEARHLHFGVDTERCAPCMIDADAARLQQVFWNLLKNAIKFTPQGGHVEIRCWPDGHSAVVEVVDNGVGIDPAVLPNIFNPFEQGGTRVTRQFGGLGLGLTITKGLVEMHGGSISAHSQGKGKGATFQVRLPLCADSEASGASDVLKEPAVAEAQSLRILLVEDHGDTAKMMQRLLMADGHEVETAGDVAAALKLAKGKQFDLLLSDLGLPDRSGLDLMRELRRRGDSVPGIALSGYGQEEDIRRSREAGFAAHLTKPTNPDKLTEAIAVVTNHS
ncbi:MAG TPA: PAS domain S-box protein [Tepidisphaeraceae bacterium]|nr:PAS domain S-box protein [Tepidisphaeraceae bacterium]